MGCTLSASTPGDDPASTPTMAISEKYSSRQEQTELQNLDDESSSSLIDNEAQTFAVQRNSGGSVFDTFNHFSTGGVRLISHIPTLFAALIPSFVLGFASNRHSDDNSKKKTQKIAALDGLRGVACLFVFHAHYAYSFHTWYDSEDPNNFKSKIMYQPFIILTWCGPAMVDVFFFISGYVLVSKALRLVRSDNIGDALSNISSAVFRRALRLYLPSMALILTEAFMAGSHLFDAGNVYYHETHDPNYGPSETPPPYLGSMYLQFVDALKDCYRLVDNTIPWGRFNFPYEFDADQRPEGTVYDKHLWTIPTEFKCSMLIFMILIATSQIQARWRLLIHVAFCVNCLFMERYSELLFITGMLFAEIDIIRQENACSTVGDIHLSTTPPGSPSPAAATSSASIGTLINAAKVKKYWVPSRDLSLFICGLYFLSIPPRGSDAYPSFLAIMKCLPEWIADKDKFVSALGAIMVTWPVATSTVIAPLFANPVSHYLGQVSFALYLVHGAIIRSLWYALLPSFELFIAGVKMSDMTSFQFFILVVSGYMVVFPVTIWAADVFWRLIDLPSISLTRWVEVQLKSKQQVTTRRPHMA